MRTAKLLVAALVIAACAPSAHRSTDGGAWTPQCCAAEGKSIAEKHRVPAIASRRFTHAQLWGALGPLVQVRGLNVTDVGRSIQGRPIRAVTFGTGPVTVLLWSQMHGDESTATMSLADLISWFASPAPEHAALRSSLASKLKIVMIPMLNPDGAELFQRENAVGVDVNRDARNLATPEARALKSLRDSIKPAFGFNLHDQNARTLTGNNGNQVAIALLAPAADEDRNYGPTRTTARLVAAVIASVLKAEIPGRLAKYSDAHEPRAFGDLMQQWGTSTVLIESGAMPADAEKQKLRELNVIAILSALNAMAEGSWRNADPDAYESIPTNSRSAVDLLVRGASLVLPGAEPVRVDVALNYEEPVARREPRVREVGDLARVISLDTLDVTGMYLHPAASMLTDQNGMRWIRFDTAAVIAIRRGRDPSSEIVRMIGDQSATVSMSALTGGASAQHSPQAYCHAASGAESHGRLLQRWIDDVWHQGRLDLVPDLIGAEYVRHEGGVTRSVTPKQYAAEIAAARQRLSGLRFTIHDCATVGDRLWTRWTMVGKSVQTGQRVRRMATQTYRISDNRLMETWMLMLPTDAAWPDSSGMSK